MARGHGVHSIRAHPRGNTGEELDTAWSEGIVGEDIGKSSGAQYEEFTYPR
jgi:hypothetical protein